MFDPSVTFEDLAWIKTQRPNKLVVKGIQTLNDARAVVDIGVDGVLLSDHGGRWRGGRPPGDRDPVRPGHPHNAATRRDVAGRIDAATRDTAVPAWARRARQRVTFMTSFPLVTTDNRHC
jgi:hypothetical protein